MLNNKEFIFVDKIFYLKDKKIRLDGRKINKIGPAFLFPTNSTDLNIFTVSEAESQVNISVTLEEVKTKALFLNVFELDCDMEKEQYVIPMLH